MAIATDDAVVLYNKDGFETGRVATSARRLALLNRHGQALLVAAGEGTISVYKPLP